MIKRLVLFFCLCLPALAASAQEQEVKFAFDNYRRYYREARLCTDSVKLEAMKKLRVYFHEHPYRLSKVNMSVPPARCLELLTPEGTFSDMDALEAEFERSNAYRKGFHTTADDRVGIFIGNALDRLCCIADAYRRGTLTADESLSDKVLKAVVHYGMLEAGRSNAVSRFHALTEQLRRTEADLSATSELMGAVVRYAKTRPVFDGYKAAKYSRKYLAEHEAELADYRAAKATMGELLGGEKLPKMAELKEKRRQLAARKKALYAEYRSAQEEMRQSVAVKSNIDHLLGVTDGQRKKEQER